MHRHVLINHDLKLYMIIYSKDPNLNLIEVVDAILEEELSHA